jgi:ABC-type antimicrobial peptide transport system, permease component
MRTNDKQDDFNEEIEAHLRMAVEDRVQRGESETTARSSVLSEFGNVALIRDVNSQMRGTIWIERVVRDIRFAARQIRKNPFFSAVLILMLSLGTAAPTLIATVAVQTLMRQIPYGDAPTIFEIRPAKADTELSGVSYSAIKNSNNKVHALSQLGYSTNDRRAFFLQTEGAIIQVSAPRISPNLFSLLEVRPSIGEGFDASSKSLIGAHSLILSDRLWRKWFRSKADIIGKTIVLNGTDYVVEGVMPPKFHFPAELDQPQLWICACGKDHNLSPAVQHDRSFRAFARLNPNLSPEAASSLLNRDLKLSHESPPKQEPVISQIRLDTYKHSMVDAPTRKGLLALLCGAILLWLIACVNATSLLFARSFARQREFMIRRAVGGSHWRIARQLFIETLIISCLATVIAYGLSDTVIFFSRRTLQTFLHVGISPLPAGSVLLILFTLTLMTAILCSVGPSLNAGCVVGRSFVPLRCVGLRRIFKHYRRGILVTTEIAMTFMLLVACGLLLQTVNILRHISLGFRPDHVLVSNLKIPAYKFSTSDMSSELFGPLVQRLQSLPGVQAVTLLTSVPLDNAYKISFRLEHSQYSRGQAKNDLRANLRAVGPDMQRVFDIKMVSGRFFNKADTLTSPFVVIVNRAFASEYVSPGGDPMDIVGKEIFNDGPGRDARVIGVIDNTPQNSLTQAVEPEIEVCIPQITPNSRLYEAVDRLAMSVAVRTNTDPVTMIPLLKSQIEAQDPQFGSVDISSMNDVVESSFVERQIGAGLTAIFGVVALLLSMGGLYGLLASLVSQRTREIGVRIAFGASALKIAFLVVKDAAWMVISGIGLGMGLVYLLGHYITPFLFGVSSRDPITIAQVAALILLSGVLATFIPAYRAGKLDAARALRAG